LTIIGLANVIGGTAQVVGANVEFTPTPNYFGPASFDYTVADNGTTAGIDDPRSGAALGHVAFNVTPVADTPSVSNAATLVNTQTSSGLVVTKNSADGAEVTHFQITHITGGTLFQNNGTTPINEGDFITDVQGALGLKFTPTTNKAIPGTQFFFDVQASTSANVNGLAGALARATITVTDPIEPTTTITAQPPSFSSSTSATFNVSGTDNISPAILTFEYRVDPTGPADPFTPANSVTPTTGTFTIGGLTQGIHTVEVRAVDQAGNRDSTPATFTWVVDTTAPAIAIGGPSVPLTRGGPVTYTITYTDANFDHATLANGDVVLNKTGTANGTVGVSGSGNIRTVTITGITGNGTLGISLPAGTAVDKAGNLAGAAGPSVTFTVDNTAPVGVFIPVTPVPRVFPVPSITITFGEAVTGVDLSDFQLTNDNVNVPLTGATLTTSDNVTWTLGNLTSLTNTGGNYVLSLTATGSGIQDAAGNPLTANAQTAWHKTLAGDDFNRANNGALGSNWTESHGNLSIVANQLTVASVTGIAFYNNVFVRDVYVEATVAFPTGVTLPNNAPQSVGLVARYGGLGDHDYFLGAIVKTGNVFTAEIYRNLDGQTPLLLSKQTLGSAAGLLRFEVVGNSLKLFLNGALVGFAFDNVLAGSGRVGVRGTTLATWDNFGADAITRIVQTAPLSQSFTQPEESQLDPSVWQGDVGNFSVSGGAVRGDAPNNLATVFGYSAFNVAVAADVNLAGAGVSEMGLVARYNGKGTDTNFYLGVVTANNGVFKAEIRRNFGGVWSTLNSKVISSATGALKFVVYGESLRLFLGTQLVAHANDTALPAGGVGLRGSKNAGADNFKADVSGLNLPALPFTDNFTGLDGSQLGNVWYTRTGNFSVNANAARGEDAVNLAILNGINLQSSITELTFTAALAVNQSAGLVSRYQGSGDTNMYRGELNRDAAGFHIEIWKNTEVNQVATWQKLGTKVVATGLGTLRFEVANSTLTLKFAGQTLTVNDTSFASGGIGIRGSAGAPSDSFKTV
jgi:hypothetical protein